MRPKTKEKVEKESLKERVKNLLENSKFFFLLDFDDTITPMVGQDEVDIPLSGILVYGKDSGIEAFMYQMTLEENQVIVEMSKVEHPRFKTDILEAQGFTIEPDISRFHR